MYYSIFEGLPHQGKEKLGETYYTSLLPHVKKIAGFHEDSFSPSPHITNKAVNIAVWDDAEAVGRWRQQPNHLSAQDKGYKNVYNEYRLRLGPQVDESESQSDAANARQYVTLLYRSAGEGAPSNDVMTLIDANSSIKDGLLDSVVYQGEKVVWISGWKSREAAIAFEKAINKQPEDVIVRLRIDRDYSKVDRTDAPTATPGAKL